MLLNGVYEQNPKIEEVPQKHQALAPSEPEDQEESMPAASEKDAGFFITENQQQ